MHESESEDAQSCPTLSDPMDCSPPGSSVHGIFQARVLEWGATPLVYTQDDQNINLGGCSGGKQNSKDLFKKTNEKD